MDDKRQENVRKSAKVIMDKFSKALAGVKAEESHVVREKDRREEGSGVEGDNRFREVMFENAPNKKGDFMMAEKKKW